MNLVAHRTSHSKLKSAESMTRIKKKNYFNPSNFQMKNDLYPNYPNSTNASKPKTKFPIHSNKKRRTFREINNLIKYQKEIYLNPIP
jgi:hypothetical protein